VQAFDDLLILEIAGSIAGAYAAKLFADYGANVIKIEPPGGDPIRGESEDWGGVGTLFAYLNTSKRSLVLDLYEESGRADLSRWLERADVVIESSAPDALDPITLRHDGPQLVKSYISPFGSTGPYARYRSNEFTDDAIGGHLYLNGEPDREPITRPGHHSEYQAGTQAFIGAMAALRARELSGRGQTVEVSHFEGMASLHQHTTIMWTHAGHILRREGNAQPGFWHPVGVYPCKDGYVALALPAGAFAEPFLIAIGMADLLEDPRFGDDLSRGQHKREFDAAILPWLMDHDASEVIEIGQEVFAPVGPVPTMLELLRDEHLTARGYWRPVGESSPLQYPRGPFRIAGHDSVLVPPPGLDELGRAGPSQRATPPVGATVPQHGADASLETGPLDGIRVLDLTRVWAGPLAGRILADLGADVIIVEAPWARGLWEVPEEAASVTHLYPDNEVGEHPWNRGGAYNKLARNKRAIALRLDDPRGKELFEALVRHSDIVLENFSPRVMAQLGLGFDRLLELNPHIIHVAMPGYGTWGPNRDWVAFGPMIESGAGLSSVMGYADSGPYRSGIAWPDPVTAINTVAATLIALRDREADSRREGREVEVPMIEAMTAFVGEQLLAAQVRGQDAVRLGNRNPERAPQGCYPCAGDDSWIAISVTSDAEWSALCELAGFDSALARMDLAIRTAQHDAIDRALADWTRLFPARSLMRQLQDRGVIACSVSDARELVEDEHLAARHFWAELTHREAGRHRIPGIAIRLSETPATYRRAAPCLGEHNAEVLSELLQLDRAELDALEGAGVVTDRPPG
jgi:crotonobetainyl-CoA:carnitine CoA-transferase CaiB-like acyl-CoA transferase